MTAISRGAAVAGSAALTLAPTNFGNRLWKACESTGTGAQGRDHRHRRLLTNVAFDVSAVSSGDNRSVISDLWNLLRGQTPPRFGLRPATYETTLDTGASYRNVERAVPSVPGAVRVRVWHLMSRGRGPTDGATVAGEC